MSLPLLQAASSLQICRVASYLEFPEASVAQSLDTWTRIMRPDDANIAGNIHGGTILKMMEEAGCIVSTRHCNAQNGDRCVAALVRVEKAEYLVPVFIGEVAHVSAEILFTSRHSLEVQVQVMAENILTGDKKLSNRAMLWYVPFSLQNINKIMEVPPIKYASAEQEEQGRKRYEAQKTHRLETKVSTEEMVMPPPNPEEHTVGYSQSSLIHLVNPADCTLQGYIHGGVTMKLMDEVAGLVSIRHCGNNTVTVSIDGIDFHGKVSKGCLMTVTGQLTFISNKSMEVEVVVDAVQVWEGEKIKFRAASAFFTYISVDKDNKSQIVPPLKLVGEDEQRRFEEGKARYLQNKAKRMKEQQQQQQ